MATRFPIRRDKKLVQIVDAALADTARRSGDWLACKPGCTQCCIGVFAINQLDAARLRRGLAMLHASAPERAEAIQRRASEAVSRLSVCFPGNSATGLLDEERSETFEEFGNDEPCPVLDPKTGLCELYDYRPMTCRVFGPPLRSDDGLGVCELCYHGASEEEIAACEMIPDPDDLESKLVAQVERDTGKRGNTIIAFSLASEK